MKPAHGEHAARQREYLIALARELFAHPDKICIIAIDEMAQLMRERWIVLDNPRSSKTLSLISELVTRRPNLRKCRALV